MPNPTQHHGQQPRSTKGTVDKVPCPWCGQPNNFTDIMKGYAGQGMVDAGDDVRCDHCDGEMHIMGVAEITVISVCQNRAPRQQRGQQVMQRQQQKPAGFLQKLLGKG